MPSDERDDILGDAEVTRDGFLGGRLTVLQPVHGFRAGLDTVLLGAALSQRSRLVADLGAGAGAAALVALSLSEERTAVLVERDPAMLDLARRNIADNGFADRAQVVELDVSAPSGHRHAAGLAGNSFDAVIANPPYFAAGEGTLATRRGRAARHMGGDELGAWATAAITALRTGGEAIFVLPAARLADILVPLAHKRGAITVLPLAPRPGEAATRILVRWVKGSGAPLALLTTRALHGPTGPGFAPDFDGIFRGRSLLHW